MVRFSQVHQDLNFNNDVKVNIDTNIKGITTNNGLINGNGLTDGNGLTIKHIHISKYESLKWNKENRTKNIAYKIKRKMFVQVILTIFLILLPLLIYLIEFEDAHQTIKLDGDFKDWSDESVISYLDNDLGAIENPSTNIIDCRINYEKCNLNFYVQTEWKLFGDMDCSMIGGSEIYILNIFIDRDIDYSTGYQINCLGADERVELQGQNGVINEAISYYYSNSYKSNSWNNWVKNSIVDVVKDNFRLEGKIPIIMNQKPLNTASKSDINKENNIESTASSCEIGVIFQLMDSKGNHDITPPILTGEQSYNIAEIIDISPDSTQFTYGPTSIAAINLVPQNNHCDQISNSKLSKPIEITSFSFSYELEDPIAELHEHLNEQFGNMDVYIDNNNNQELDETDIKLNNYYTNIKDNHIFVLDFSPPILLPGDKEEHFILTITPNKNLIPCSLNNYLFRLPLQSFFVLSPARFFTTIPENSNSSVTIYLGEVPDEIIIDGIFKDWEAIGEFNYDIDIPSINDKNSDILKVGHFSNQDFGSFAWYLDTADLMLPGTSVPPIFFSEKYSLDEDSNSKNIQKNEKTLTDLKFIKNVNNLPEELIGFDRIWVLIDIDDNINTGYSPSWLSIGADYLIQILGREYKIYKQQLLRFDFNSSSTWPWVELGEIPTFKNTHQLECQVIWRDFGIIEPKKLDFVIYISDWSGIKKDSFEMSSGLNIPQASTISMNMIENNTRGRNSIIDNDATTFDGLHKVNQRKSVRDINGYWYSFWVESSGYLKAKRSNDTKGENWSSQELTLAGASGSIITKATLPAFYPSVAIYKPMNINQNAIHLVWSIINNSNVSICYSKCINLTNGDGFSKPSSWITANNTQGFEILHDNVNLDVLDNYGFPSIALDRYNEPHIVWQNEYFYNSNYYFNVNYTTYNQTSGWHQGKSSAVNITPWTGYQYKSPCIDVSYQGIIHVAYSNVSTSYRTIEYRQCWDITDSLNTNLWGNASRLPGTKDITLSNGTNGNMSEPSLLCDSIGHGRVWIVTSEQTRNYIYNIWFVMEDFKDSNYWSNAFTIESGSSYELKNPIIGYDSTNKIYCIWEKRYSVTDIQLFSSSNSSGYWTTPNQLTSSSKNIYPQIPKNLTGNKDQFSFIFKEDTNDLIVFYQIPEFSELYLFFEVLILTQLMIIVFKVHNNKVNNRNFLFKNGAKNNGLKK